MSHVFAFLLGVVLWTFLEYCIHRFMGHRPRAKNLFAREHMAHHAETDYFAPAWKKVLAATPVCTAITLVFWPMIGLTLGAALALGTGAGWFAYEVLHRLIHVRKPIVNFYGSWARRHHLYHHYQRPKMNHGVTSPLWDVVFRTYEHPVVVRVPRHQAERLKWVFNADGTDVAPELAGEYVIA